MPEKKIRVMMSKVGLDGHTRGARIVSQMLRDAGMEVIYLGLFQTAENIVSAAIQEDVDVLGLSSLSGEHMAHTADVMKILKQRNINDILVIVGGVIPLQDIELLKAMGVSEVFRAGTSMENIANFIRSRISWK